MNAPPNHYLIKAFDLAGAIEAAESVSAFALAIQQTLIACSRSKADPHARDDGDPFLELRLPVDTANGLGALVAEILNRIDVLEARCCRRRIQEEP